MKRLAEGRIAWFLQVRLSNLQKAAHIKIKKKLKNMSENVFRGVYILCMVSGKIKALRLCVFRLIFKFSLFLRSFQAFLTGGERCVCCGDETVLFPLCEKCSDVFFKNEFSEVCSVCGKSLLSEIELCSSCRRERLIRSADGVFPVASYRLWRKNLLFFWKSEGKRILSPFFAKVFYTKICSLNLDFNCVKGVVPVPPRPGKIRSKGWDQMEDVCFYLKNLYGIKVFNVLRRNSRQQQKKLSRVSRLELTEKSYELKKEKKIRKFLLSPPEAVVLLDDVLTTGSTVEACASELKKAGVKKVFVITIFIVD